MTAIIISVGDELVLGQTVDTNSAWISQQIAGVGCGVLAHLTVADDLRAIETAIREAAQRCDFIIITGGIGPTADDLTRYALAAAMDVPLELNEAWLRKMREYFAARNRVMPESNSIQAMIPRGAQILQNDFGTAAGMRATLTTPAERRGSEVFVLPGVPTEMKGMFAAHVLPIMRQHTAGAVILSRVLHTFGLGESVIAEMLGELMRRDRNPSVGTTVSGGIVSLRINARFDSLARAGEERERTTQLCRDILGDLVFAADDETLQQAVGRLLADARKTVTTAESCTGGLLAKMLTDVAGSSNYFKMGFITYSNEAKYERLGVPTEIINIHGAVSEPVVELMARNARRLAKADYALGISGVAGPSGGSAAKPVGTVCIALASPVPRDDGGKATEASARARTFLFPGDREWVRDRAAKMALTMLRFELLGKPLPF